MTADGRVAHQPRFLACDAAHSVGMMANAITASVLSDPRADEGQGDQQRPTLYACHEDIANCIPRAHRRDGAANECETNAERCRRAKARAGGDTPERACCATARPQAQSTSATPITSSMS
jgi:hypothetical protein